MIIILVLAALVIGGLLVAGVVLVLVEAVRRLFWLGLRLLAAGVVAVVAAVAVAGAAGTGQEWIGAPVMLALGAGMLWLTREWGREPRAACVPQMCLPSSERRAGKRGVTIAPPTIGRLSLIDPPLRERLDATEAALERSARDDLGAPAAEWLAFWRRRVPDLIAAAEGVFDDADDSEKAAVVTRLAGHLGGIVDEADRRLGVVRAARRDLFATRGAHADGRVREG